MVLKDDADEKPPLPPDDDKIAAHKAKNKARVAQQLVKRRALMKQQEAERKLPMQLMLVLLNSIGAAVVVSMLAALGLRNLAPGNPLTDPEAGRFVLFMSFAVGFFLALLLLVRRLPPNWWKLADEMVSTPKYAAPTDKWGGVLNPNEAHKFAPLFDTKRPASGMPAPATLRTDKDADDESFESSAPATEAASATEPGAAQSAAGPTMDAAATRAAAEAAAAEARRLAEEQIATFAAAAAAGVKTTARALDAVGKFATQLVLAGGASALAQKFMLSAKDAFGVLVHGQTQSGTARVFAESFAANAEHYAQRPTYRPLIDSGQAAMDGQLRGEGDVGALIAASVTAWGNDDNKKLVPKITTFLMTDIVDAGGLAQRLGNLQTQRVIRAHHQAVRTCIEKFGGTEIRNGGDGALATFSDPDKATAAAKDILHRIATHNAAQPHLSANVRIAVHAGEAAADDDGYFGSTVTTTARICQLGQTGQILTSDLIKAFCKTGAASFKEFGGLDDPNVDKPRMLFELTWSATAVEYGDIGKAPGS